MPIDTVLQIISMLSSGLVAILVAYTFLRKPQEMSAIVESRMSTKIENLEEGLNSLSHHHDSDISMLTVKIDKQGDKVEELANTITRLATIIEERLPKK
jgi:hypothetical protein